MSLSFPPFQLDCEASSFFGGFGPAAESISEQMQYWLSDSGVASASLGWQEEKPLLSFNLLPNSAQETVHDRCSETELDSDTQSLLSPLCFEDTNSNLGDEISFDTSSTCSSPRESVSASASHPASPSTCNPSPTASVSNHQGSPSPVFGSAVDMATVSNSRSSSPTSTTTSVRSGTVASETPAALPSSTKRNTPTTHSSNDWLDSTFAYDSDIDSASSTDGPTRKFDLYVLQNYDTKQAKEYALTLPEAQRSEFFLERRRERGRLHRRKTAKLKRKLSKKLDQLRTSHLEQLTRMVRQNEDLALKFTARLKKYNELCQARGLSSTSAVQQ
eukprot:m.182893 g.182893  ORF g.182893 m.182893 type:complete len:331 (+) comp14678_c0_seq1:145-1137(+)